MKHEILEQASQANSKHRDHSWLELLEGAGDLCELLWHLPKFIIELLN
jgi:hypothetical protein